MKSSSTKVSIDKSISKKIETVLSTLQMSANSFIEFDMDWWRTSVCSGSSGRLRSFKEINLLSNYYKDIERQFNDMGVLISVRSGKFVATKNTL